jgi:hypothetical protein
LRHEALGIYSKYLAKITKKNREEREYIFAERKLARHGGGWAWQIYQNKRRKNIPGKTERRSS